MQFTQLQVLATTYDDQTVQYAYDGLSRLLSADIYPGNNVNVTPLREYAYSYDRAGNRLSESLALNGGGPTITEYEYTDANQIYRSRVDAGAWTNFTYDNNGNLTDDGVNEYTWDRANRLLEMDTGTPAELTAYAYDGVGNRISQAIGTSSPVVTQYLLDTQPGLTKVLTQTTGGNTDRFIHSQRGVLAHQDNSGDWFHPVQDGLGSIRGMADDVLAVQGMQHYAPYGTPYGAQGNLGMPFGFTGEQIDANELVYLRARYLNPAVGAFVSLDPFEGTAQRPMSLNGYNWVEGNPITNTDPSGELADPNAPVAANSDYKAQLQSSGRSLVPAQARDRFADFESFVSQRLGQVNTCPNDPSPYKLTYRDILTLFVGGEFGVLANSLQVGGVRVGVEAVARYYYDFAGSDGLFDGTELWLLLGNVHSFYDETSNQVLYERMVNSSYRTLATQILSGSIDGQNVTGGQEAGRPWNWGNRSLISERTRSRLRQATTGSLNLSIYYRQEMEYDYNVVAYFSNTEGDPSPSGEEFVLWTLGQEYCFRSDTDGTGAPLTGCAVYDSRSARQNREGFDLLPIDNRLVDGKSE